MAEEKIELTPDELKQVGTLLEPLTQAGRPLFPMEEKFKSDMTDLDRIMADGGPGEEGELDLDAGESGLPDASAFPDGGEASPEEEGAESSFEFEPESTTSSDSFADSGDLGSDSFSFEPGGEEPSAEVTEPATETPAETFDFGETDLATPEEPATPATDFDFGSEEEAHADTDFGGGLSTETDPFGAESTESTGDAFAEQTDEPAAEAAESFDFGSPSETPATSDMDFGGETSSFSDFESSPSLGGDDAFGGGEATSSFDLTDSIAPDTDSFGGDSLSSSDTGFDAGGADFSATSDFGSSDFSAGESAGSTPAPDAGVASFDATADESDLGDLTTDLTGLSDLAPSDSDSDSGAFDTGDLSDMTRQANLSQGIGDEFTDEELAKIRARLDEIPPGLKKAIITATVDEKVSRSDQQLIMHMLIDQATPDAIADFLEPRIGYRPDLTPPQYRKDGVQIIYADGMSPEEIAGRRKKVRITIFAVLGGVAATLIAFGSVLLYNKLSIAGRYKDGLAELSQAALTTGNEREAHRKRAEAFYQKALSSSGTYDPEVMNKYGLAYLRAGYYDDAFEKLFGRVEPAYDWADPAARAPLIRLKDGSKFPSPEQQAKGDRAEFLDRQNVKRKLEVPGAYTVTRLRDGNLDKRTLLSLGKFHSHNAQSFTRRPEGQKYKNDDLGIDYYRLILTLMEMPDDVDARSGIGEVYYNRKEYASAAREYNKIIEKFPNEIKGHAGLLNTYIQIWHENQDPRYVLEKHRLIQRLGLEKDLPIYLLTKLAGFYIDLNEDDVRIRYQVDPVNSVTGLGLEDNATHLLELVFKKEDERDGEIINGASYGEGFYQRGRFLLKQKETLRALRQFQNAHQHDPRHYLAVREMGAYYRDNLDFARAEEYFKKSLELYNQYKDDYGAKPEDETLIAGDRGLLFYDMGSLLFLKYAGTPRENKEAFADSRIYPDRGRNAETSETQKRRELLSQARDYFGQALKEEVRDEKAKVQSIYWMGWIDYISSDFESALVEWEGLQDIYSGNYSDPVLLMARANSYYYTDQNRSALGDYLKLQNDLERRALSIDHAVPEDPEHQKVFLTLAALYNNLGAVYEKEFNEAKKRGASQRSLEDLEKNSLKYYWKSIESARKVEEDNEIARTNLQKAFRSAVKSDPALDDWISPALPGLTEKKKK